jgi:nicotinamidase-related amidase
MLELNLREQESGLSEGGRNEWKTREWTERIPATNTALLLCDVWDTHWCRGAVERLEAMIPRMNETVAAARTSGVQIVHAPSGTMDQYEESPARKRVLEAPSATPNEVEHVDPPMPVDASDHGSDTGETKSGRPYSRQHAGIEIDHGSDLISDEGSDVYSCLVQGKRDTMLILGVHTNMCVVGRSFGIKQMVRWGIRPILIRDLTDAMYNPAMPPYVSHDEGTQLTIGYIEKFWCPSVLSEDIINSNK